MMDLVEKWSAFLPNTESISPRQLCAVSLGEVRELVTDMKTLRARSEYWKAEHLAGNKVIDELRARVAELEAQIAAHERVCGGKI